MVDILVKARRRPQHEEIPRISAKWRKLFALIPGYDPVSTRGAGEWFDEGAADHVCGFFPGCLCHVKGKLAGKPYEIAPWEQAIVGCLFGWKRRDGTRRYRQAFIYVPKKNDKTTLAAGLVLYGLTQLNELSAEIYSVAASKDQAGIVFDTVAGMVKLNKQGAATPSFGELTVYGQKGGSLQKSVIYEKIMGRYRPLAADADTADGASVFMAVVDELHRHKNGDLMDIMIRGTSARLEPLVVIITTADFDRLSACNQKLDEACRVRDNGGDPSKPGFNPSFLPVIYEALPADDWTDPKIWAKANPNLGRSKSLDYMKEACENAKHDPVARAKFLRLDLNVKTQQSDSLFDLVQWDACPIISFDVDKIGKRRCFGGLDMGRRDDLAALCWAFEPLEVGGTWDFVWRFWCPEAKIKKREFSDHPYRHWQQTGALTATEGDDVDFETVKQTIVADGKKFNPVAIGYDPAGVSQMTQELDNKEGFKVLPVRQGLMTLNEPTVLMLSLVRTGKFNHRDNPVMRWMAGNAMDRKDCNNNVMADKDESKDKIDGISATANALRMFIEAPQRKASIYSGGRKDLYL